MRRQDTQSNTLNLLRRFRREGLARSDAYAVLESLREESEEHEDRILELMDIVVGYCPPEQRVWAVEESKPDNTEELAVVRPSLYAGQPIPFGQLSPDSWEEFVYSSLNYLAPKFNAVVEGGLVRSADGGFDTWLRRVDEAVICVQCKRLTDSLGAPKVAFELAKVAMRSALEKSDVREHYIMTTGSLTQELPSQQRESGLVTLLAKTVLVATTSSDLKILRAEVQDAGLDIRTAVTSYVTGLDSLKVWSGRQYEKQLTSVWSKLSDILERHFQLDIVIREHPRPDIEVDTYLLRLAADHRDEWLELGVQRSVLPHGVRAFVGDDPLGPRIMTDADQEDTAPVDLVDAFLRAPAGECTFVVAPGGGGKSTSARMTVAQAAARSRSSGGEGHIPILLSLGDYRGDLTALVHRVLGVTHGHWTSLSGSFLIVGDGFDEVPPEHSQNLIDELEALMLRKNVACVLTMREGGSRRPVVVRSASACWAAQPLSIRQLHRLAESRLGAEKGAEFLRKLRPQLKVFGAEIFALPFGAAAALRFFEASERLPATTTDLLHRIIKGRIDRNMARLGALPGSLRDTPRSLVRALVREVAFEFRVVRQRAKLHRDEAERAVAAATQRLKQQRVFGSSALSELDGWLLCVHYEFLVVAENSVSAGHDLIVDYLAGELLSERWQQHQSHLKNVIGQDSWVFAAAHVSNDEISAFIDLVRNVDLLLAARCAAESGKRAVAELEPHCVTAIDSADLFTVASGIASAGVLATDELLSKLRRCRTSGSPERSGRATETLASIGDVSVLETVLEAGDRLASISYATSSGGEIATWQRVPGQIAVEMARQRLGRAATNPAVVLSIQTVRRYGEKADFDLVQQVMLTTERPKVYAAAVWCLNELDSSRTQAILSARVGSTVGIENLRDAGLLHQIGGEVVITADSLKQLVDGLDSRTSEGHQVLGALEDLPFTSSAAHKLRTLYDAGGIDRDTAWQLAPAHGLPQFDDAAWAVMRDGDSHAYGYAARFAINRGWEGPELLRFATTAYSLAIELCGDIETAWWHVEGILDVCIGAGMVADVGELLGARLPTWIDRHVELLREERYQRSLPDNESQSLDATDSYYFDSQLPHIVVLATRVAGHLPTLALRRCVHLSMIHTDDPSHEAYGRLLCYLEPDELDEELESLEDPYDQLPALASAAANCGATPRRITLLLSLLPDWFNVASHDQYLAKAVRALWCEDVFRSLVDTIANGDRSDPAYGLQMASRTNGEVVKRLSAELVDKWVTPALLRARTDVARERLQLWAGIGRRRLSAAGID